MNRSKRWRLKHKDRVDAQQKSWRENNKHKKQAHVLVRRALEAGDLIKPDQCSECSAKTPLVAHHHDYKKPLAVHWICRKCHAKEHGVAPGVKKNLSKGESHATKLTASDVRYIRENLSAKTMTQAQLSRMFGVTEGLIYQIKKGKVWTSV